MKLICTLTPEARTAQELEWSDLAALALTSEHIDSGVASTYPLTLADRIEELATREIECCGSWLAITHERGDDHFRLTLTARTAAGVAEIRSFTKHRQSDG